MSLKEYAPVDLEDERESEEFSPSRFSTIRKGKRSTLLRRSLYFLAAQLLIVAVTAVVSISLLQKYWGVSCAGDNPESHIRVEERIINRTPLEQQDEIWGNITSGQGYVLIENPEKYHLPPGVINAADGARNIYGLAYAHQMHCLVMIRAGFHSMQKRLARRDSHPDFHIEHCFDYLRQNIECVHDMTLEWADLEGAEKGDLMINGYGIPHQCRKKEDVSAYMAARKPPVEAGLEESLGLGSGNRPGHQHGSR